MEKMQVRNRMSAETLVVRNNSTLDFIQNPNTGNLFFTCGNITGYVSPAVKKNLNNVSLDDLQYAECAKPGTNDWVPCLMMVGRAATPVKSLGANKLR